MIRIIPTVSPSIFSLTRLHPDKNGVRNSLVDEGRTFSFVFCLVFCFCFVLFFLSLLDFGWLILVLVTPCSDCLQFPTPHYNNDILGDMFVKNHLALLHACSQNSPGFVDAIALGKVWLQQRGMSQEAGHVDGFLLSMLLVHLVQQRKVNRQMSSYQILRILMQFIGQPLLY